ncbi:SDR family oxidoreductase [Lachnospiraceae bacterium 54-53]
MNLSGKAGIVTGGSSGIGWAAANVLAEAGARVYAVSRSGKPKVQGQLSHPGVIHVAADVCDYEALSGLVNRIGTEWGIDFLVNNAGITVKCRAEAFLDSDFEQIHRVNVSSVFKLSCLCFPYLKQSPHRGRIINITSMAAHLGFSEVVPYCSSKGAVLSMTRGLAVEWAADRINVNSIAPGWFPSEMSREVMDEGRKQKILSRMPVHRFGDPRDIGEMAKFLVSDGSEYITGQDFAVDGGALAFGY